MLKKIENFGQKFVIEKSTASIESFNVGDTITVGLRIVDDNAVRIQDFTGVCIAYRKKGVGTNFIVRKMSTDVSVERNVLLYSPLVAYVKLVRKGQVRRAKLYYMRNLYGKAARIKEKKDILSNNKAKTNNDNKNDVNSIEQKTNEN